MHISLSLSLVMYIWVTKYSGYDTFLLHTSTTVILQNIYVLYTVHTILSLTKS